MNMPEGFDPDVWQAIQFQAQRNPTLAMSMAQANGLNNFDISQFAPEGMKYQPNPDEGGGSWQEANPVDPHRQWTDQRGLTSLGDAIGSGQGVSQQMMDVLMGKGDMNGRPGSSIAPAGWAAGGAAGNQQDIWNDFVARQQDWEAGKNDFLGINQLGGPDDWGPTSVLAAAAGGAYGAMGAGADAAAFEGGAHLGGGLSTMSGGGAAAMGAGGAMDMAGSAAIPSMGGAGPSLFDAAPAASGSAAAGGSAQGLQGMGSSYTPDFSNLDFGSLDFSGMGGPATGGQPPTEFNPASDMNTNFNNGMSEFGGNTADPLTGQSATTTPPPPTNTNWLQTVGQTLGGAGGLNQLAGGGAQQGGAPGGGAGQGPNMMGVLGSGLEFLGNQQYQSQLMGLMQQAVNKSDPFSSQRPQYQQMYNQYNTDPNFLNNDPVLQGIQNNALRQVESRDATRGYLGSGNMLHDVARTATETAAPYALQRGQQLGQAAGAYNNPAAAGQVMSSLSPLVAGATQQGYGALGSMVQNGIGQNGAGLQGLGNMISSGYNGLTNLFGE